MTYPNCSLHEIVTSDKHIHQGVFYKPENPGKKALLLVHGLSSTFYHQVQFINQLAESSLHQGVGLAAFNNRGHDLLASIKKVDRRQIKGYTRVAGGAGQELFAESVYDIAAGISFLAQKGFTKIILVGHSSGANKVCFYGATKKDPRVAGVILMSPISDRLDPELDKEKLQHDLTYMETRIKEGKGEELLIGYHFFPLTPKRFVSLFTLHSEEDTFDIGNAPPRLTYFKRIKKPLLVLFGENDEYTDRPVREIIKVFDTYTQSRHYTSHITPQTLHSFQGKEIEITRLIGNWIRTL